MVKYFVFMELHSLGGNVPCPFIQSWKRGSCGSSRTRGKASIQSFHSMLELGLAEHWANYSPLCGPRRRGACPLQQESQKPGMWEIAKTVNSLCLGVYSQILWPCNGQSYSGHRLAVGCDWHNHLPMASRPYSMCICSPVPSTGISRSQTWNALN